MAIPAMLAFDMDQTSGAEVGVFFKSNFNRRGRLLAILAGTPSLSITCLAEDGDPSSGGQPVPGVRRLRATEWCDAYQQYHLMWAPARRIGEPWRRSNPDLRGAAPK
jgi:hypothetical protein